MRVPIPSTCLSAAQHHTMRALVLRPRAAPLSTTPLRSSALSAIHRGLRNSQKVRPQGSGWQALEAASSGGRKGRQTTTRQRRDPGWEAPNYTIKKGKKDITDKGPQPMSRRSRFNNPDEKFGKRSQVWQIKHGNLRSEMEKLVRDDEKAQSRTTGFRGQTPRYGTQRDGPSDNRRRDLGARKSATSHADQPGDAGTRTSGRFRDQGRTRGYDDYRLHSKQQKREPAQEPAFKRNLAIKKQDGHGQASTEATSHDSLPDTRTTEAEPEPGLPIRIHHTTAASQFLYGRYVIRAALAQGKRQLYRLYLYDGYNKQPAPEDRSYASMAERQGAVVHRLRTSQGLEMMNRMTQGRPHNGFVLEASPLPQLPVKALSYETEEGSQKGFRLELDYQSAEEAAINGTSAFVGHNLPAGRHPLVIFLEGVLDPGNFGGILRSAAFLGATAVAVSKNNAVGLTPAALKASAGASESMTLLSVKSSLAFLEQSKSNGWTVIAAAPIADRIGRTTHLTIDRLEGLDPLGDGPVILVIGSEGEGLGRQIRRAADHTVSIPSPPDLPEDLDSLNMSVATALVSYALLRKQVADVFKDRHLVGKKDDEEALF